MTNYYHFAGKQLNFQIILSLARVEQLMTVFEVTHILPTYRGWSTKHTMSCHHDIKIETGTDTPSGAWFSFLDENQMEIRKSMWKIKTCKWNSKQFGWYVGFLLII